MEAVGFALSVVSVANLFQTAVDCFEYVQLGKAFSSDLQTCYLRLDSIQLRLSRWGEAVGLGVETVNSESLDNTSLSGENVKRAEQLLGHIINLFHQAEEASRKFEISHSVNDASIADENLPASAASLRQRIRDICRRRQRATSKAKKAKWALYEREHLNNLINDVQTLVSDLVDLYPAEAAQRQLCDREAEEIQNEETLPALKAIAAEQDKLLDQAIARLPPKTVC